MKRTCRLHLVIISLLLHSGVHCATFPCDGHFSATVDIQRSNCGCALTSRHFSFQGTGVPFFQHGFDSPHRSVPYVTPFCFSSSSSRTIGLVHLLTSTPYSHLTLHMPGVSCSLQQALHHFARYSCAHALRTRRLLSSVSRSWFERVQVSPVRTSFSPVLLFFLRYHALNEYARAW